MPLNQKSDLIVIVAILMMGAIFYSPRLLAYVDRNLIIQGELKGFDSKTAVIKTESGEVIVPAASVKALNYRFGQSVMLFVDIADFLDLNKATIAHVKPKSPN